jgi:hypothetical protein
MIKISNLVSSVVLVKCLKMNFQVAVKKYFFNAENVKIKEDISMIVQN